MDYETAKGWQKIEARIEALHAKYLRQEREEADGSPRRAPQIFELSSLRNEEQ